MTQKERIRLAVVLQNYWKRGQQRERNGVDALSSVIDPHLKRLRSAEQALAMACQHSLELMEPSLQEKVEFQARTLRIKLQDLEGHQFPRRQLFPLREFYQDLVQLQEEFVDVRVAWKDSELIVETENIILQDVELGPFTMRLNWNQWAREGNLNCLQVIAEEPNTSELIDGISHPHVREGELCSGEALMPLLKALQEGRLAEFFLIVRAVLSTYNARSAYVKLEDWHGNSCYDCGDVIDPDERSYCDDCQHDYCGNCSSSCSNCNESCCLSCLSECSTCQEPCCRSCSETTTVSEQLICRSCKEVCPSCQGTVGPGDLHAETGLCPDCHIPSEELSNVALSSSAS